MRDLNDLSLAELVDLLSEKTLRYTRLFAEKRRDDEFYKVREMIQRLQKEIEGRTLRTDELAKDPAMDAE